MHTLSSGSEHTHCISAQQRKLRTCTVISSYHQSSCAPQAQVALSSADGPTMPQHTQHSLIHVLLLWISILSIVQLVFITLFFTAGHHGLFQISSAVEPEHTKQIQPNNTPSSLSENGLILGKGTMLTFEATAVNEKIKWKTKNSDEDLVSLEKGGAVLSIKEDGFFFLNLQVTLTSCNASLGPKQTVTLKRDGKVILLGWINMITCSTGLLGKVNELPAGSKLEVNLPTTGESINETLTHLDIIYMFKKQL